MTILVNYYSPNFAHAGTGQSLDILGAQADAGELVDDGEVSTPLDHDAIAVIQAITPSWMSIGTGAVVGASEKIEAGDYRMRFLKAGLTVSCEAATSTQADIVLLTSLDGRLQSIDTHLNAIDQNLASPATDIPPFVRKSTLDLTNKVIACAQNTDYELMAAVSGKVINLFRLNFTIAAAGIVSLYSDVSATGTLLGQWEFPTAGGGLDLRSEGAWPLFPPTTAGKSLVLKCSTTAQIRGSAQMLQV